MLGRLITINHKAPVAFFGNYTVAERIIAAAFNSCQHIAKIGDSQEASPGGAGTNYIHRLNTRSLTRLGLPPSETWLAFPISNANNAILRTTPNAFTSTSKFGTAELPESNVRSQNGTGGRQGFYILLNPRADSTGGMSPPSFMADADDWFQFTDLRADFFLWGHGTSPGYRIYYIPNESGTADLFESIQGTFSDTSAPATGWSKVSTTNLALDPANPYPATLIQGYTGSVATGLVCGGMRYRDADRDEGIVFQSFSDGGDKISDWDSDYGGMYDQFKAYGNWGGLMLCFGANDAAASVSAAQFKTNYLALIDKLRGVNWDQQIPIILVSDLARTVAGSFTQPMADLLAAYPGVMREIANERDDVLFIDMYTLANAKGYDPAADTTDGVHFNASFSNDRADWLFDEVLRAASRTAPIPQLRPLT